MRLRSVLLGAAAAAAGVVAALRHESTTAVDPELLAPPVATTLAGAGRSGAMAQRGRPGAVRLDLDRARAGRVEPVVEFLTFVQQRRGEESHLLFVRYDDLDALATSQGEDVTTFLARLDQLGVVVSTN